MISTCARPPVSFGSTAPRTVSAQTTSNRTLFGAGDQRNSAQGSIVFAGVLAALAVVVAAVIGGLSDRRDNEARVTQSQVPCDELIANVGAPDQPEIVDLSRLDGDEKLLYDKVGSPRICAVPPDVLDRARNQE